MIAGFERFDGPDAICNGLNIVKKFRPADLFFSKAIVVSIIMMAGMNSYKV